jgi:hypothetical protein
LGVQNDEIKAFTDLGNAERISEREKHEIRYCKDIKRWLFWIGIRWQVDETGEINRRIQQAMKSIYEEVKYAEGDASLIEKIGITLGNLRPTARSTQLKGLPARQRSFRFHWTSWMLTRCSSTAQTEPSSSKAAGCVLIRGTT